MRSSEGKPGVAFLAQAKMPSWVLAGHELSEEGAGCWMDGKSGYSKEEEAIVDRLSPLQHSQEQYNLPGVSYK